MTNNKASAGPIIIIIIVAIVLILGGGLFIILNKEGYFKPDQTEVNETKISAIIKIMDEETGEQVKSNYLIYTADNYFQIYIRNMTIVAEGIIEQGESREIKLNPYLHYTTVCWSDDYYLTRNIESITQDEINYNISVFGCVMPKIEHNLQVTHTGEITGETSQITLNLTAEDRFQKAIICSAWTSGFIDVSIEGSFITCETGAWLNYTFYNTTSMTYDLLPEGEYICGENIETCQVIQGGLCKKINQRTPIRLTQLVDSCHYLGTHVDGNTISVPITIKKSEFATRNDEVTFYIIDQDRRWFPEEERYIYFTEFDNINIGASDILYTIKFEGGE